MQAVFYWGRLREGAKFYAKDFGQRLSAIDAAIDRKYAQQQFIDANDEPFGIER